MSQAAEQGPAAPPVEQFTTPPPIPDRRPWALIVLPILAAVVAFAPVVGNEFVDWDDRSNFLDNPGFAGLGWPQIRWAWTTVLLGVYQPLSWMLLEVQYALWGLAPWGYHLSSLALYLAAIAALYALSVALLERSRAVDLDRGPWPVHFGSAIAVALFAIHPLRTEVVAWVSCQPYLPCALFSLLALLAYLRAHPADGTTRPGWAAVAFLLFVAALLSKVVAVTLPLVLLILDVYAMRRIGGRDGLLAGPSARSAWAEKLPFFATSAFFAWLASWSKQHYFISNVGEPLAQGSLNARVGQMFYAVIFYLYKTVRPVRIAAFYPLDSGVSLFASPYRTCGLLVVGITVAFVLMRRRWPGLLAAWASYLVILAPNSGLVLFGPQVAADRYSFLSMMGLVILAAAAIAGALTSRLQALVIAVGAVVTALVVTPLDWCQCRTWRDTLSLWGNALAYYPSAHAHMNLGVELSNQDRYAEAELHLVQVVRMAPEHARAHRTLAHVLAAQGKLAEAEARFAALARLKVGEADLFMDQGILLSLRGKNVEAAAKFAEVIRLKPEDRQARRALGVALALQGKRAEAEAQFAEVVRRTPNDAMARVDLGKSLGQQGKLAQAEAQFAEAVRLKPASIPAIKALAMTLGLQGKIPEAEAQFQKVLRLQPDDPESRAALAKFAQIRGQLRLPANLQR
jgi:tetratricopeptide (TPR) repeat protein